MIIQTFSNIPDQENIKLFTHLIIREDAHTLYGFYNQIEREIFILLISVSGVGPSIAMTMLSSMATGEIQHSIAHEEVEKIIPVRIKSYNTSPGCCIVNNITTYHVSNNQSISNSNFSGRFD